MGVGEWAAAITATAAMVIGGGGFGGVVLIGPSCSRWIPGVGRVYVCY
jgi:hypothetical protein